MYTISSNFLNTSTHQGQYRQVKTICNNLPDDSAVLWIGDKSWNSIMTVRSFCGVTAYRTGNYVTDEQLRAFYDTVRLQKKNPVVLIAGSDHPRLREEITKNTKEISAVVFEVVPSSLTRLPSDTAVGSRSIFIGKISESGIVEGLY